LLFVVLEKSGAKEQRKKDLKKENEKTLIF